MVVRSRPRLRTNLPPSRTSGPQRSTPIITRVAVASETARISVLGTRTCVNKYDITVQPSTAQDGLITSHRIHCSALTGDSTLCNIVISTHCEWERRLVWSEGRTDVRGSGIPRKSHFESRQPGSGSACRSSHFTSGWHDLSLCGLRAALHNQ
jgi:hypothetical protein